MLAIFGLGHLELLIVLAVIVPVVIVVVVLVVMKGGSANPGEAAALRPCPGCGHPVSPAAAACPQCGRSLDIG